MKFVRVIPVAFAPASKRQKHGRLVPKVCGDDAEKKASRNMFVYHADRLNGYIFRPWA